MSTLPPTIDKYTKWPQFHRRHDVNVLICTCNGHIIEKKVSGNNHVIYLGAAVTASICWSFRNIYGTMFEHRTNVRDRMQYESLQIKLNQMKRIDNFIILFATTGRPIQQTLLNINMFVAPAGLRDNIKATVESTRRLKIFVKIQ